jgi:hypothetical protein
MFLKRIIMFLSYFEMCLLHHKNKNSVKCYKFYKVYLQTLIPYFTKTGIFSVRRISRKFGFKEVSEDEDWTLYWTDYSVALERVMEMKKYQVMRRGGYTYDALLGGKQESLSNPEISCSEGRRHEALSNSKISCPPKAKKYYVPQRRSARGTWDNFWVGQTFISPIQ